MYYSQIIAGCFEAGPQPEARAVSPETVSFALADSAAWRDYLGAGTESGAGVSVTPAKALTIPAVWQAVAAKSHDATKIPCGVYRKLPEGGSEALTRHPAARRIGLYEMANDELTAYQLWRRAYAHATLYGNGFIWIERGPGGVPLGLYNLLPDRTTYTRAKSGRLYVTTEWSSGAGGSKLKSLPVEDVLCLEGVAFDDEGGRSLVAAARELLGQSLAQRLFTSKFFKNNATLGGVLQVPPGTAPEKIANLENTFSERYTSTDKAFKIAVLRDGVKFHSTMATLQQSAAPELDEQIARQVARFFNLPPSRLGVRESVSYNSLEGDRQNYYDTSLTELIIPAATQCQAKLLTQQERDAGLYVRHKVAALLWANASTVNSIGVNGVNAGIYTPDEVRGWFEMNPLPNGAGARPRAKAAPAPTTAATDVQRAAFRALATSAIERAAKRLAVHADKAKKTGRDARAACDEQRAAAAEILSPVVEALRAYALTRDDAGIATDHVIARLRDCDWDADKLDHLPLLTILGL